MDVWQPIGRKETFTCTTQIAGLLAISLGVWYGIFRLARWVLGI